MPGSSKPFRLLPHSLEFLTERWYILKLIKLGSLVSGICAIACFIVWLGDTDWLMGHTYGSTSAIIAAFRTSILRLVGMGICLVLALFAVSQSDSDVRQGDTHWQVLQRYAMGLLLIPVGIVAAISFSELPRALQVRQATSIRSGAASVDELIDVLKTPRPRLEYAGTHNAAITELGRRGPQSKNAVPVLATLLQDPASTQMAAKSLAAIGPDARAAIPALANVIKREQGIGSGVGGDGPSTASSLAGQALTEIGVDAVPELIQLLPHQDRYVRICAARSLGNMGSIAEAAVPALNQTLEDEDETVRRYSRRALKQIAPNQAELPSDRLIPQRDDAMQGIASNSWSSQTSYSGDPGNRPRGTIIVRFSDGYRWLITDRVRRREQRIDGNRNIQAAISDTRRYEHVLGTNQVRAIESSALDSSDAERTPPQADKTDE